LIELRSYVRMHSHAKRQLSIWMTKKGGTRTNTYVTLDDALGLQVYSSVLIGALLKSGGITGSSQFSSVVSGRTTRIIALPRRQEYLSLPLQPERSIKLYRTISSASYQQKVECTTSNVSISSDGISWRGCRHENESRQVIGTLQNDPKIKRPLRLRHVSTSTRPSL
jgi:hypothetical protein